MPETEIPGLPKFVRSYQFGNWKWIAPSVHLRPIVLPYASDTRVFLLRSGPGTRMLEHAHTGFEMTCVLSGAFSQARSAFWAWRFSTWEMRPWITSRWSIRATIAFVWLQCREISDSKVCLVELSSLSSACEPDR